MPLKERLGFSAPPLYLIDGAAFIYRAFYAYPDLKRSDGFPTNALFIVLRILFKLLKEEQPEYVGFFLDGRGPTFRHTLYPAYKAQRLATPEALAQQFEPIREAAGLLGLPVYVSENAEADDLIAALANRAKKERPVVIVGADKDFKQCLDVNVALWDPGTKQEKLTTLADFSAETGLTPQQWPDYQALVGDSSDNIPGAPGIGPKTALKLLAAHPSLEALRDNLDALSPKERDKLAPQIENVFLYRRLTTLSLDASPDIALESLRLGEPQTKELAAFLTAYEFRSLLREMPAALPTPAAPKAPPSGAAQHSLFSLAPSGPTPRSSASLADCPSAASRADLPDTQGKDLGLALVEGGFRLAAGDRELFLPSDPALFPVPDWPDLVLPQARTVYAAGVKELLTSKEPPFFHEVPFERFFDLSLAAYLINPEERDYSLPRLADRFGGNLADAAAEPALLALALGRELTHRLESADLARLMADLEMPLIPVLAAMERLGVGIDQQAFAAFLAEVQSELETLEARIHTLAGNPFNLRSSQQLAELLFKRLGLAPSGKTPGGLSSTSQEVLEKLEGKHPIVTEILAFRKLEKLRSTYLEPFPKLMGKDHRVRTTFNQMATATGRLSSSNPNLQNIPIRGPQGRRMRSCFTAQGQNLLAAADYSQIELRVLAHLSDEPTLIEAFRAGEDIHARTASLLYDKAQPDITPDERRNAKTVNFGLIYGMGPQKLARDLGVSLKEAKAFIDRYFSRLTRLKAFFEEVEALAMEQGFVVTLAGRRRLLPDLHSKNAQLQSAAKRQAVNTRIQGSAADIIKIAMLKTHADQTLQSLGAKLILQVHDELILDAPGPEAHAREAGQRLAEIMSNALVLNVPLVVDWGVGRNWAAAH